MPEENEYEIEEGDTTQYFHVTAKNGKTFTVERRHYTAQDFTDAYISDENGWPVYPKEKRYKQISAAVSKYLEKERRTVQIEVKGGTVVDVRNLPEGYNYELIDRDVMEEEQ